MNPWLAFVLGILFGWATLIAWATWAAWGFPLPGWLERRLRPNG